MAVTHAFVSSVSDGGDTSLIRPSDWNAAHVVTDIVQVLNRWGEVSITNDATAQTLFSFSVPGGTLGTDKMLRLTWYARVQNNTGTAYAHTYRLSYGGTAAITAATATTATSTAWRVLKGEILFAAGNSASAQNAVFTELISATTNMTTGEGELGANMTYLRAVSTAAGGIAVDSTADRTLLLTLQLGAASTAYTYTVKYAKLELV